MFIRNLSNYKSDDWTEPCCGRIAQRSISMTSFRIQSNRDLGRREDEEFKRQIKEKEGICEPLLVEPHPDLPGKYLIIDGDRRWTNSLALVKQGRQQYRRIPVEITDRTLLEEEMFRVWIYIHRQR